MALPSNKIKKVKLPNNSEYEIIPERLQGGDDKCSFSVGQSLKSNSTRVYFDRDYESNLISLLQGLTYSSSNPLNIPICNLMTITNPNYGNASYYLLAVDLTSQNLGYCLATFDDYSASSTYHLTVRYATTSGSGYGMTWTQGYNNLDGSDGFYFIGEDLATCTVASISSGSSWNGSIIYSDEGTSSGSGNRYEAKLPPLSHDSVLALEDDIKNSTITLTQGGVTKGSFTLNQDSDTTIDLDAGGGSIDYNELINKPIENLSDDSSDEGGGDQFYTGQSIVMGTDRIYLTKDESALTSWLNSASDFAMGVKVGNDTGFSNYTDGANKIIYVVMDKIYILYATGSGTFEGESYTQGYNMDILDSDYSFGWIEPMPSEYIGYAFTVREVTSGDWNGSIVAPSPISGGNYSEGVYYKMPDEELSGLTPYQAGDTIANGDKTYFDTTKESELLAFLQAHLPNDGDSTWVFNASGPDANILVGHFTISNEDYYVMYIMDSKSTPTFVYANKAGSMSGITWTAGFQNLDSDGGCAWELNSTLTINGITSGLDLEDLNGVVFGSSLAQGVVSGAIYRCVNGSLKKVLNEGDIIQENNVLNGGSMSSYYNLLVNGQTTYTMPTSVFNKINENRDKNYVVEITGSYSGMTAYMYFRVNATASTNEVVLDSMIMDNTSYYFGSSFTSNGLTQTLYYNQVGMDDIHEHTNKSVLDNISSQTAYSSKGTSTKVPTITTNTSGQVTSISETSIAFPVTDVQLNGTSALSSGVANVKALPNFNLNISHQTAGNPRQVKFLTINYTSAATYFKMSATSCHDNGTSYQFLEDIIIGCTTSGTVVCNVYKYCQQEVTLDNVVRNYGDVFYVIDTTNKIVDFYILCGQYASSQFTPATKIGNTTIAYITQYTGTATYYSSGTKVWANGNSTTYAKLSDIPTVPTVSLTTTAGSQSITVNSTSLGVIQRASNTTPVYGGIASYTDTTVTPSNCLASGFYYAYSNSATGNDANPFYNYHTSAPDFRILTTAHSANWLQQIGTDFRTDHIYFRRKVNGSWTDWIKVNPWQYNSSTESYDLIF